MSKKLDKIFKKSKIMNIDDSTKLVIMSDCHRGAGDNYDNFIKNKNIFLGALSYYYHHDFTYIELGDGDEMWEVKNYKSIIEEYIDVFKKMKKFHDSNRLFMIYGNHDIKKKFSNIMSKYFYYYYDKVTQQEKSLLNGLTVEESLVLKYKGYDIFLIHGHQVDFFNGTLWRLSMLLVRYIWKFLERLGIKDPTSAAKNNIVNRRKEKKLEKWSIKNNKILISGHTHRAIFPKVGQSLYFNDGSCIHPNGITCLEIENGHITLAKWVYSLNQDKMIFIKRNILEGSEEIIKFFVKVT